MKKFFMLAVAVSAALTGCVKEDVPEVKADQEITFEVAKYKPSTKAEVDYSTSETFGVYAYLEKDGTHDDTPYMNNVQIVYKESGANKFWAPKEGTYFWPTEGHLDFIAYSPYNSDATSAAVPKIGSDVQQTIKYEQFIVDAAKPVDLLYADKAVEHTINTAHYGFTGVPVLFHHALAKLNFKVKALRLQNVTSGNTTTWEVVINKISIKNIYDRGNLILSVSNSQATPQSTLSWSNTYVTSTQPYNVWRNATNVVSKEWVCDQTLTLDAKSYGLGTAEVAENYFILPQTINGSSQEITIDYTITTTSGSSTPTTETISVTKKFSEFPSVSAWEIGKNITYIIEIDPYGDEIHFAPKVVDWENVDGVISI